MSNKPTKYGIKAFTLAESEHGYILDILIYTGRDTLAHASPIFSDLPQPAWVVVHVAGNYLGKGHHIFTDRYYTSVPLAQVLLDRVTGFTGTSMSNRVNLPNEL